MSVGSSFMGRIRVEGLGSKVQMLCLADHILVGYYNQQSCMYGTRYWVSEHRSGCVENVCIFIDLAITSVYIVTPNTPATMPYKASVA